MVKACHGTNFRASGGHAYNHTKYQLSISGEGSVKVQRKGGCANRLPHSMDVLKLARFAYGFARSAMLTAAHAAKDASLRHE